MTHPVTVDQLRNLTDRAGAGLTPDEQQRLRDGIDALHAERADARQKFATVAAQRDRLRTRMNTLADRWEHALAVDKPYARTLRAEISIEPFGTDDTPSPATPTRTHIWDGSDLPDWLTGHRWEDGQLVIRTPDGDTRPQAGWWLIGWSDGTITVASPTSGERVYGDGGMADRLERAEHELARHAEAEAADIAAGFYAGRVEELETELAGVRALRDRWVKAGPPPLGQQISRWWDRRLAELGGALSREQPDARPEPEDLTGAYMPDPPIGCLTPDREAHLAQDGIDTPGCDCGHHGMGASWHSDDCPWRSGVVDCPGRPTPG